jgi:probable F420-dependent oxidoreductase
VQVLFAIVPPFGSSVTADGEWMRGFAVHAEACGFESVVLPEHSVVIAGYSSRYPYSKSGQMPVADDCPMPDPLDLLAYLAGVTTRLHLATGALVLPNHHPVALAKRAATIDQLSRGRLRLCVGVGWMREEIEACGADFETRGRRTDECIDAMRALWAGTNEGASFKGEFFSFDGALTYPKPHRPDGIPIHIGGGTRAAARRAGRRGDGFQPMARRGLPELLAVLRREAETAGRDPDSIELTLSSFLPHTTDDTVAEAESVGARRLVITVPPSDDLEDVSEEMSAFADRMGMRPAETS